MTIVSKPQKIAMINNKYPSDFTINVTRNSNMCSFKKLLRSIYYTIYILYKFAPFEIIFNALLDMYYEESRSKDVS